MKSSIQGIIITAAFVGPGTITTASIAGATLGYQIVWALVFSIVATCTIQLMAKKLGYFSGKGLSEAAMSLTQTGIGKLFVGGLIVTAIGIGNATYQGGNITGAALGLSTITSLGIQAWSLVIGCIAGILLLLKKHALIEKTLVVLVGLMSIVFITVMFIAETNWLSMLKGLNPLKTDFSQMTLILALIGTTIVPYNLYLQSGMQAAASVATKLKGQPSQTLDIHHSVDWPLFASIGIGGVITLAIVSCAATTFFAQGIALNTANIASQLQPLLGDSAQMFFAIGLFSAGITSAITAPLAAGYAVAGVFGWHNSLDNVFFRLTCLTVLAIGTALASLGFKPLNLIVLAQVTNALLLPISVVFLLIACNNTNIMGKNTNSTFLNVLGAIMLVVLISLSIYKFI